MTAQFEEENCNKRVPYVWMEHIKIDDYYKIANPIDEVHMTDEDICSMAMMWKITIVVYSVHSQRIPKYSTISNAIAHLHLPHNTHDKKDSQDHKKSLHEVAQDALNTDASEEVSWLEDDQSVDKFLVLPDVNTTMIYDGYGQQQEFHVKIDSTEEFVPVKDEDFPVLIRLFKYNQHIIYLLKQKEFQEELKYTFPSWSHNLATT